jgi:porin
VGVIGWKVFFLAVAVTLLPWVTQAEDGDPLWSRETLTGDWGGARTWLAERGVTVQLEFTEFYQGMISGSGNNDFKPVGRSDGFVNFDTGKLGLWSGGGLNTHLEYRSGDGTLFRGGSLLPTNTGAALPLSETEQLVASSVYLTQRFSDSTSLMMGKINVIDLLARDPFFGGWGIHRFQNVAFVAPPSGLLPPVIMGGVLRQQFAPFSATLMIYDPKDQTDNYSPKGLFDDGVNVSLTAAWAGAVDGRSSSIALNGTYSTKDGTDLSQVLLPPEVKTEDKRGSYGVSLQGSHLLFESSMQRGQGLGVYGKAGISDGNPNPIRAYFVGGFAGHGIVPSRPLDSFGIGYFNYKFSEDLKNALDPSIKFNDEKGIEVFYNFALTPWFRLTADFQIVDPATGSNETEMFGGLRANVVF